MVNKLFLLISLTFLFNFAQKSEIDKMISEIPSVTKTSIIISDFSKDKIIYSRNIDKKIIPASIVKIFTAAMFLDLPNSENAFKTSIFISDSIFPNHQLNGNLIIVFRANPLFDEKEARSIVQAIKNLGIKEVRGKLIFDESYFDSDSAKIVHQKGEKDNLKVPPISALIYKRNRNPKFRFELHEFFKSEFAKNGIIFKENEIESKGKILISEIKPNVDEILAKMLKESDNFIAEIVLKICGTEFWGIPGENEKSISVRNLFLSKIGIEKNSIRLVDGSGISRHNQISAKSVFQLIEYLHSNSKKWERFVNFFSISGIDGTLKNRFLDSELKGKFKGKTGMLFATSALVGIFTSKNGDEILSIILFETDGNNSDKVNNLQEKLVEYFYKNY